MIEDYAIINNAVGEITIGNHTRIGLGNTIIGPVIIGNNLILNQNVGCRESRKDSERI